MARGWWRLPRSARRATAWAAALVIGIDGALRLWPLDMVARRVGVPLALDGQDASVPPLDPSSLSETERLHLWAVRWVLDRWLSDGTCLRRALAWGRVLRTRQPQLCIGLLDDGEDLAHAWLHLGDATLDAPAQAQLFSSVGQPAR